MDIDPPTHDNDTIRRISTELDQQVAALRIVARIPGIGREVAVAIDRLSEARFWLKETGHNAHFDMPEGEVP